jgi:hypothetical protein
MIPDSPAVKATDESRASDPLKVPPDSADQNETCVTVSVAATSSQMMLALFVAAPAEAAPKLACFRVVSVAAFDVPAEPGSPVWSFTQIVVR